MNKPKILLSGNKKLQYYVDAVNETGGIADAKYLPEIDTDYDGLILCGGNDINPVYYNEEINGAVNIDHERDQVEFKLLQAFLDAGKPVLGICRGSQLLNIAFGGTMCQDLEKPHGHCSFADFDLVHRVRAEKGSIAESLYGTDFAVNSFHHQAVNKLGEGLKVTLVAESDGVVEGFEHTTLPVFGVQWHPERMCFAQKREDTVDGAAIFAKFIQMCKQK